MTYDLTELLKVLVTGGVLSAGVSIAMNHHLRKAAWVREKKHTEWSALIDQGSTCVHDTQTSYLRTFNEADARQREYRGDPEGRTRDEEIKARFERTHSNVGQLGVSIRSATVIAYALKRYAVLDAYEEYWKEFTNIYAFLPPTQSGEAMLSLMREAFRSDLGLPPA